MADLPTGTVTFLLTDVEGSTRLWDEHPEAMRAALVQHDAIVEFLAEQHRGQVVRPRGEGDSRFCALAPGPPGGFPPPRALEAVPNTLPARAPLLGGGARELAEVRAMLLRPETRLLTLVGPGGAGKTRLALQAAAEALDDFPDGVFAVA